MNLFRPVSKLLTVTVMLTGAAFADVSLDFGMAAPTSGNVSFGGGSNPLVGTNISIDTIVGINGTPLNNNVTRNCMSCVLNFQTGNLVSTTSSAGFTLFTFGGGGSVTISGTVDLNNNGIFGDAGDASGLLLSGAFGSAASTLIQVGTSNVFGPSPFTALLNNTLAGFYGTQLQPLSYTGIVNLSFFTSNTSNGGFSSTLLGSGDVIASTPEPVSIILLGTTLVLCGTLWRRRLARS